MLVITRKRHERIYVGDKVVITVTEMRSDRVRLGIDAPKEIEIVRDELVLPANAAAVAGLIAVGAARGGYVYQHEMQSLVGQGAARWQHVLQAVREASLQIVPAELAK